MRVCLRLGSSKCRETRNNGRACVFYWRLCWRQFDYCNDASMHPARLSVDMLFALLVRPASPQGMPLPTRIFPFYPALMLDLKLSPSRLLSLADVLLSEVHIMVIWVFTTNIIFRKEHLAQLPERLCWPSARRLQPARLASFCTRRSAAQDASDAHLRKRP